MCERVCDGCLVLIALRERSVSDSCTELVLAQSLRDTHHNTCLLYTSDAADDTPCVDLGGRRIIKKNIEDNFCQYLKYVFDLFLYNMV